MQGLSMWKRILIKDDQREFCAWKSEKTSILIKNVIESEDTLMHKAECPSNYFFQHFHTLSGWADKKRSNLCPNFARNTQDLNTV